MNIRGPVIYLDNAATTFPKPRAVPSAVADFMREKAANPGRSGHRMSMDAAEEVYRCRSAAAELFNAPGPECVAFFMNATQAINAALKGALTKGGHVVTSNLEHNAVMRPLYKLQEKGVTYTAACVDADDDVTVRNFAAAIRPDTVMIACTHASNVCGKILPVERIGRLCHQYGLQFLVDASQTAGAVPLDMQACNIDYLCMPGHKGLYGPMGTGLLLAPHGDLLETLVEGGTGSNSVDLKQPDFMPDRLESGTLNAAGIAGLRAGIAFVNHRGLQEIAREEHRLALGLYDALKGIPMVRLYTPRPESGYVSVVSFNIGEISSVEVTEKLNRMNLALRGGLHCSPAAHSCFHTLSQGMVRASIGAFNTSRDVRLLADAVEKIKRPAQA